jgi:hypothetical protein
MKIKPGKARVRAVIALAVVFAMGASSAAQAVEAVAPTSTYIVSVDGDFNDVVRGQLRDAGISIDDEFEELFLEILGDLKVINKLDKNSNKELVSLVKAYEKIGDIIEAGVEV